MVSVGYDTLFHKVNIPEPTLLKIKKDFDKVNSATISTDALDFTETLNK